MTIWLDADSLSPKLRKTVLKAALRHQIQACYVANRELPDIRDSELIKMIVVGQESDAADEYILSRVLPDDMVITRDIPLAYALLEKGAVVINDGGGAFTEENIGNRLGLRNLHHDLREKGILDSEGKRASYDKQRAFASCFDKELHKIIKKNRKNKKK